MAASVGRPSDYDEVKTIEKAQEYLKTYENQGELIPSVSGLAVYLGVSRSTVNLWKTQEDKASFSDIIERILSFQETKLINGGLSGGYNSVITKLLLSKHGYSDKAEIDNKSSDGSMSPSGNTFDKDAYKKAQEDLEKKLK